MRSKINTIGKLTDLRRIRIHCAYIGQRFMKTFFLGVLVSSLLLVGLTTLQANESNDLIVVTNKDVSMSSIDDNEIRRLFLGQSRRLPNGDRAALAAYAPLKAFFNSRILGRSDTDVARIWSKLKFSGRQAPPRTFDNVDALVEYVKSTPNALAYLPGSYRKAEVRVMSYIPGDTPAL